MKVFRFVSALCLLLALSVCSQAFADGGTPKPFGCVGAAFGPAGTGFPVGKFAAVVNYMFAETDGVRLNDDEINDNVKLTKHVGIIKFRYGIAPGLDVRTATPVYDVDADLPGGQTAHYGWLGDTTVVLHKVVMNQGKGNPFSLAFDLGVVLPTADGGRDNNNFTGNQAWGAGAGVGLTYFLGANRLDQEFNYYTFSEAEDNYRKPDRFRCYTGWAHALSKSFDIGAESNFEWNGESETFDQSQDDARREWYVGPKMVFKHQKSGTVLGALFTLPVYRDYDSPCPSDGYRFELKLVKVF